MGERGVATGAQKLRRGRACFRRAARSATAAVAPRAARAANLGQCTRCLECRAGDLDGIKPPQGALSRSMPSFGPQMSESEMVALVKFVRGRYSKNGAWSGVKWAVKEARSGG